ncbi:hypothetical protein Tco_0209749 [Tanacetum coccineum]
MDRSSKDLRVMKCALHQMRKKLTRKRTLMHVGRIYHYAVRCTRPIDRLFAQNSLSVDNQSESRKLLPTGIVDNSAAITFANEPGVMKGARHFLRNIKTALCSRTKSEW